MVGSTQQKDKEIQQLLEEINNLKEKLYEKELLFSNMLNGMIAGNWDWHIPKEYHYISPSFKELLGYQDYEVPNSPDAWPMLVHHDDLQAMVNKFNEHVASHGSLPFDHEARFIQKDGSYLWIQTRGEVVEWDKKGKPIRMVGNHANIDYIKSSKIKVQEIKQALVDKTKRYELAANATGFGIWELDLAKMQCIWDDNMFGLYNLPIQKTPDHQTWLNNYVHPEDRHLIGEVIEKVLQTKEKCGIQFRIIRTDGQIRQIKSVVLVKLDEAGHPYRLMGSNIDITKELELERQQIQSHQLKQKNKELEQFAYIASHDMQEPLRTVKNFAYLIDKQYRDQLDDNAGRYLQFITDATTRMSNLVKGLLDYSRIGVEKHLSEINCNKLLKNIQADLKTLISENNASIQFDYLPIITAYPTELRVLFQNLIVNAIKFKKKKTDPVVKISCQILNNYWKFSVEDNGIGIAKEDQEKIFIIFQRLHQNNISKGTGIGLAHSQRIVGLHNGKIWVESEIGKGSIFYFTISHNLFNS